MARYRDAVQWIADNDDADLGDPLEGGFIVSIHFAADLFGRPAHEVYAAVTQRRRIDQRVYQRHMDAEEAEEARMMEGDPMYEGML